MDITGNLPSIFRHLSLPGAGREFAAVRAALQAGEQERAHRLLSVLIETQGHHPELWLLLAWTAPSQRITQAFFQRLLRLHPDHPLAQREAVPWSGREWVRQEEVIPPAAELCSAAQHASAADRDSAAERDSALPGSPETRLAFRLSAPAFAIYLAGYLLVIALAEALITYSNPSLGLALHGGLLVLLLLHASLLVTGAERRFLLALSLAPLIRLLSLSMPLAQFDLVYWYLVIGMPLSVSTVMIYRLGHYRPGQVGLVLGERLPLQLGVALGGIGLGYLEYLILQPEPLAPRLSLESIWLPALILLVFTGFLEEFIFRGLLQRAAAGPLRDWGPLYISLLFAVLHTGYKSWVDLLFVFMVGYAFSLVVARTRSLLGVSLAHGLTNISLFLIFPFLLAAPAQPGAVPAPPSTHIDRPGIWIAPPIATAKLPSPTPTWMLTTTVTSAASTAGTATPTVTPCNVEPGWAPYQVQPGDTLAGLYQRYKLTAVSFLVANCLPPDLEVLVPGEVIYVPYLILTRVAPRHTPTATQPPADTAAPPEARPTATNATRPELPPPPTIRSRPTQPAEPTPVPPSTRPH